MGAAVTPATLDVLDRLRDPGAWLALVSNATADTAEAWPHSALATRFDVAVFSSDVGVAKPEPAIYLTAVEGLGATPAECVYVGDGAADELTGAAATSLLLVHDLDIRVIDAATGELLRQLVLDSTRDY